MLRLVRQDPALARFQGRFFEKSPLFWPIERAARHFADLAEWPSVARYDELWGAGGTREGAPRFVLLEPPRAKQAKARHVKDLYDARIVRGEIPTRAAHWHDYLNALVWVTFPLAKRALHERQHVVIDAWLRDHGLVRDDGSFDRLPNARTRVHDALALVDEGGIVVLRDGRGGAREVLFGHAIFEGLVLGTRSMIAREIPVDVSDLATPDEDLVRADALLAARIRDPALTPEILPRRPLAD